MEKIHIRLTQDSHLGKAGQVIELPLDEANQAIHGGIAKRLSAGEAPPKPKQEKQEK